MKNSLVLLFIVAQSLFSWGGVAHRMINKQAVNHLPPAMTKFIEQQSFLEQHSTDPDTRRNNSDTAMYSEQYRHFLDIDDYPNFKNLDRNFRNLINTYGWERVKKNGTNPWALVQWMDTLTAQLKRGDWNASYQTAADIGHYVGDPHQPLHATANYNGQLTGNNGIHSRYESRMIERVEQQIVLTKDSVFYIPNVMEFAMEYILVAQSYVDSVLAADNYAKAQSGWNGSGTPPSAYYDALWAHSKGYTVKQLQLATVNLASLWYTAWVNAGLLEKATPVKRTGDSKPKSYNLYQNYPNPFNPKTTIQFDVAQQGKISLDIISIEGKTIASLVDATLEEGSYTADWDATQTASGVYLYRLNAGAFSDTKKLVVVK